MDTAAVQDTLWQHGSYPIGSQTCPLSQNQAVRVCMCVRVRACGGKLSSSYPGSAFSPPCQGGCSRAGCNTHLVFVTVTRRANRHAGDVAMNVGRGGRLTTRAQVRLPPVDSHVLPLLPRSAHCPVSLHCQKSRNVLHFKMYVEFMRSRVEMLRSHYGRGGKS